MKIAIRGHESRGKEVIQILENLDGINRLSLEGHSTSSYYYINDTSNTIHCGDSYYVSCKKYTLEEFEKEFPFKVGNKVIDHEGDVAIIIGFAHIKEKLGYSLQYENGRGTATPRMLTPYKEMKEERNITLTLDKAKEWYKKGGELKEIALQAFTEKELNPLPRSWEEYIMKYGACCFSTRYTNIPLKYDALLKLEQLRDCWRNGWVPNWSDRSEKWCIALCENELSVSITTIIPRFLTFPTKEMAKEFLKCFRDLIEKAGDLI